MAGQEQFGIRFGRPDVGGVIVVAKSLVAGDVVVEIAGQTVTISLAAIGTDAPVGHPYNGKQAGYVGSKVVAGLSIYSKYNYTAIQNGNVITGYTWTAPGLNDDYILVPLTCDNIEVFNATNDGTGGYTHIRDIAESNPDKAVYFLHIDDHYGYMAGSRLDDTNGTGHKVTAFDATSGNTVYDFCLQAFANFGLYSTSGNNYCTKPQNDDRQWCMRNIPVLPAIGDWDAGANDMGMKVQSSTSSQFTNSQVVWEAFLAPFQGDNISAGTQAWAHKLGCVKIIAPDAITNGSGDAEAVNKWDKATTVFGATQVPDLITAFDDSSVPFKIWAMTSPIRYLREPDPWEANDTFNAGAQYPIGGNESFTNTVATTGIVAHAEYKQLMTNAGGLMSKSSCNGKNGVLLAVNGNDHFGTVLRHANTSGVYDEWFYQFNVGTINGSVNFNTSPVAVGDVIDGTTVEYIEGDYLNHDWWVVPMFVYGSREVQEIEVKFYDRGRSLKWNKKFTARSMNDAIAVDYNPADTGTFDSGEFE